MKRDEDELRRAFRPWEDPPRADGDPPEWTVLTIVAGLVAAALAFVIFCFGGTP